MVWLAALLVSMQPAAATLPWLLSESSWEHDTEGLKVFVRYNQGEEEDSVQNEGWRTLTDEYRDANNVRLFEVDCTSDEGFRLCEVGKVGLATTFRYGVPSKLGADMQTYEGGWSYDELAKFAEENLGPACLPRLVDTGCNHRARVMMKEIMQRPPQLVEEDIAGLGVIIQRKEEAFVQRMGNWEKLHGKFNTEIDNHKTNDRDFHDWHTNAQKQGEDERKAAAELLQNDKSKQLAKHYDKHEAQKVRHIGDWGKLEKQIAESGLRLMKTAIKFNATGQKKTIPRAEAEAMQNKKKRKPDEL